MAGTLALSLQQFMASLDNTCLPKILQVCSGVYFQGSVYEISGSEVSFSTGDLIKVIGFELQSVCCEDISSNDTFELPINYTGLFKVVPDAMPYSTVEEMVMLRPVGLDSCLPFTFTSRSKMSFDNLSLGAGIALTVISNERHEGKGDHLRCRFQGQQEASADVCIPLSSRGEFHVCEGKECFTLQEIMSSPSLRSQRFSFINTTMWKRPVVLSPIYRVQAIMNLRKHVINFPSNLEVDVIDVTDVCKDVTFVTPLSLTEAFSKPDETFPAIVEILESPETCSMFKCSWLPELRRSQHLIFHKKETSTMLLISSLKSRKAQQYFLVSQQYGGRFRRRPREFNSVYELYVASIKAPGLRVCVTRNCEEVEEEGLPALGVGENLEVVSCKTVQLPCGSNDGQKQSVEALFCQRLQDPEDGEDDEEEEVKQEDQREEIYLPLYMQGHFVEVLSDNKKYRLRDLCKKFNLPLDVKVVNCDTQLETDPLVGFTYLRIEGSMLEPTIQASFPQTPNRCFEIPAQRLFLSVYFTTDPLPWPIGQPPECHVDTVTEVKDTFFYEFQKQANSDAAPPPRPPKQNLSRSCKKSKKSSLKAKPKHQSGQRIPTAEFGHLTLNSKRRPPAPPAPPVPPTPDILGDRPPPVASRKHPQAKMSTGKAQPNTYVSRRESQEKADEDSDHDYELVNENFLIMMKEAQENVMFY